MKSPKIFLASSRPIGDHCREYLTRMEDLYTAVPRIEMADVVISVMYDQILPERIVNTKLCYNFHPGLLPNYRGAGAYSWAILNRDSQTGVTLHEIDKDIDHGKIIAVERVPIRDTDTAETLFDQCMQVMYDMFRVWLSPIVLRSYPTYENEGGHLYLRKHLEEQRDLTRYVRAFTFEGKPNAFYTDKSGNQHELSWDQ